MLTCASRDIPYSTFSLSLGSQDGLENGNILPWTRTTSHTQVKVSGTQLNHESSYLQCAPLDIQKQLGKILNEEDGDRDDFRLIESVEAFLRGYHSSNSDSQITDLVNLNQKIHEKPLDSDREMLTGSLVSSENFRGTPLLEALLDRRTKDGALLVKKWLQETLRRENVNVNVKSRPGLVTKAELQTMIKALSKSQSSLVRNKGIIQLASGED
ncbi:hypothetical protein L6164_022450 [Bauhinia variegata]|uniref:Uncharacterized protein n=1 Tax=Bauhinia variegata TaxID=167791 RepID=A0ACB9MI43_BAUVA|nr:hypothetical protein L6164_022450 [Bauhinia variegata]